MSEEHGVGVIDQNPPVESIKPQLITAFSEFMGESILPPSKNVFDEIDYKELKEEHPVRFNIWEELRGMRDDYSQEAKDRLHRLGKYLHMINSLDRYSANHLSNKLSGTETLYDEQFDIFELIRSGLELGETSGYVKLPTGTGKTVLFTELIEAMGLTTAHGEGIKSLIVVPTTIPIGQTSEALEKFASGIPYGKVYGEQKDLGDKEKPVTIITDESLAIQIANGQIDPESYDFVVFDEAHNYLTENKKNIILNNFANAIKMGFTATPHYSEEKSVSSILLYEYASMPVAEAVRKGMLADVITMYARCGINLEGVRIESNEFNDEDLENKIDIKQVNDKFAEFYKKSFEDESGIIACIGISHANHISEAFKEQGITADVIHGYLTTEEKSELIKKHEQGGIQILCYDRVLAESYDQPRASVCLNLRPTMSIVMAEQRAGRVLRLDPNNPSKVAKVIDVIYANKGEGNQQILYPQILEAARLYGESRKNSSTSSRSKLPEIIEPISIEGLEITIDPEEIMRITSEQNNETILKSPEDWMLLGDSRNPENTLCEKYSMSNNGVKRHIIDALALLKQRSLEQGKTSEWEIEQEKYVRLFKSRKTGVITPHYSPEFMEVLDSLIPKNPKEGWELVGNGGAGTLSGRYNIDPDSIRQNVEKILLELERNHVQSDSDEKWDTVKKRYTDTGKSKSGTSAYYSPELIALLDQRIMPLPPEEWSVLGEPERPGTVAAVFDLAPKAFPQYIEVVLNDLEAEFISKNPNGNWEEEQKKYFGKYRSSGGNAIFYSPEFVDILRSVIPNKPPPDWQLIGTRERRGTIACKLDVTEPTVKKYATALLNELKIKFDETYPGGNWISEKSRYLGDYRSRSGTTTYYSPEFIELLESRIPPKAPKGWMVIGNGGEGTLAERYNFSNPTIKKRADELLNRIKINFLTEHSIEDWSKEQSRYIGQHLNESGPSIYYSPDFVGLLDAAMLDSKTLFSK